ncbi:MAG TPA: hypothetical protein VF695_06235 [Sphingomonas sp.]|jgi:hypothetical protein
MSMIERVARAIARIDHNGTIADEAYWADPCTGCNAYRHMARAAIEAMREITPDMERATLPFRKGVGEGVGRLWSAMITAALAADQGEGAGS